MNYFNLYQAQSISRMWNFLNSSYLNGLVSDNIIYESYWVLTPVAGKEEFLQHMGRKLQTVWNAVQAGEVGLYAQVVSVEGIFHECFVKLNQVVKGQPDESLISISVNEDGTIHRITVTPLLPNVITHEILTEI